MKSVVVGGTGLIGKSVTSLLRELGHEVVIASPSAGIDTVTGAGLDEAARQASLIIDVSNARTREPAGMLSFFEASTKNVLAAARRAGTLHLVALSVVGLDRLQEVPHYRAKLAQEQLIASSGLPYTLVRATQFHEFVRTIIQAATTANDVVRVPAALIQPIAAKEVARFLVDTLLAPPRLDVLELGGPETLPFEELARQSLTESDGSRTVVADEAARYFGAALGERSLVTRPGARLGRVRFSDWVKVRAPSSSEGFSSPT